MYYLLTDNRIIDSNNKEDIELLRRNRRIIENEKIVYYSGNFLKNKQCMNCSHWNCIKCQYAKKCDEEVKKQSENVFDLIEMGDCYLYQNKNMFRPDMVLINDKVMFSIFGSRAIKTPEYILAIYKPNEKGDYIKVWEKKDE